MQGQVIGAEYFQGVEMHNRREGKKDKIRTKNNIDHRDRDHTAHQSGGDTTESRKSMVQGGKQRSGN